MFIGSYLHDRRFHMASHRLFTTWCIQLIGSIVSYLINMEAQPPETDAFRVDTADLEHNYHNIHSAIFVF